MKEDARMTRGTRLFPVLVGGGVLGVLIMVAFSWREIAIQYHFSRLRSDPAYVSEVIEQPEGTVARDALRRAIATSDGQETFCHAIVLDALRLLNCRPDEMREGETVLVNVGAKLLTAPARLTPGSPLSVVKTGTPGGDAILSIDASQAARFVAFRPLVKKLHPGTCKFQGMGELQFCVAQSWFLNDNDPSFPKGKTDAVSVWVEKPRDDSP